jgi:hypothetical protein
MKMDIPNYIKRLVDEFPIKVNTNTTPQEPAAEDLFAIGNGAKLDDKMAKILHIWVAKALFAYKRARPDIHTVVTVLCTHVKRPNQNDWKKLIHLMQYINGTRNEMQNESSIPIHHYQKGCYLVWDLVWGGHSENKKGIRAKTVGGDDNQTVRSNYGPTRDCSESLKTERGSFIGAATWALRGKGVTFSAEDLFQHFLIHETLEVEWMKKMRLRTKILKPTKYRVLSLDARN